MKKWCLYGVLFLVSILSGCADKVISTVKHIPLNNEWKYALSGSEIQNPAIVPGMVQTDLFRNRTAKNSLYSDNGKSLQWIAESEWEYKTTFVADENFLKYQSVELCFEGIDTYASVFVNDKLLFQADNMFRKWEYEMKSFIKNGSNTIKVVLHSPVKRGEQLMAATPYKLPAGTDKLSVFIRKAPYQFGWDWMPAMVTTGIWKPVSIKLHGGVKLENIQIRTVEIADTCAWLSADFEIHSNQDIANATVTIYDGFKQFRIKKGTNYATVKFRILQPELWWPNGMGEQKLYDLTGKLFINGYLVDSARTSTGIRTIELFRDEDPYGRSFYFRVNGLPVFIKGANYVPPSGLLTDISWNRKKALIDDAAIVGMNMLRIWGGGVYEDDAFYDYCDKRGILIWQDFMFACSMYPGDSVFTNNVKEEVAQQIKRLRNHASLAIWCGNNESDVAWINWGWQKEHQINSVDSARIINDYKNLFENLIPEQISLLDDGRPYIPSSPLSNWGKADNFNFDNMHYWGVWHGEEAIDSFRVNVPRFMSEYGMQSFPSYSTLASNSTDSGGVRADYINRLQQSYKGNRLLMSYIESRYGKFSGFEDLCYLSQLTQRDAMQIAIESHRKNSRFCMGTMYWQLNDAWDGASWSTIETSGKWKAAHFKLQQLYASNLLFAEQDGDSVKVYFQSDKIDGASGVFKAEIFDFRGRPISIYERPVSTGYLVAQLIYEQSVAKLLNGLSPDNYFLKLSITNKDSMLVENIHYFKKPLELKLADANLNIRYEQQGENVKLILETGNLIKDLFLECSITSAVFSDNYFDLLPGKSKELLVSNCSVELLGKSMKWRSYRPVEK